jgi:hypothetical protein
VERLIEGKDGVIRLIRLRSSRDRLERAPQHLYPFELICDSANKEDGEEKNQTPSDANARSFVPKRQAAIDAATRIQETLENELKDY